MTTGLAFEMLTGPSGVVEVSLISLSGTVTAGINEVDIVAGGKTIILTLGDDTWVAAGAAFNAQRQPIIDKFVSDGAEVNGWNAERSNLPVTDVVRTSDRVVTITLSALVNYDITVQEVVSGGAPAAALVTSTADLTAPEKFTIQLAAIAWPEGGSIEWPEGGTIQWP